MSEQALEELDGPLRSCPRCGDKKWTQRHSGTGEYECGDCGYSIPGPTIQEEWRARRNWNKRLDCENVLLARAEQAEAEVERLKAALKNARILTPESADAFIDAIENPKPASPAMVALAAKHRGTFPTAEEKRIAELETELAASFPPEHVKSVTLDCPVPHLWQIRAWLMASDIPLWGTYLGKEHWEPSSGGFSIRLPLEVPEDWTRGDVLYRVECAAKEVKRPFGTVLAEMRAIEKEETGG